MMTRRPYRLGTLTLILASLTTMLTEFPLVYGAEPELDRLIGTWIAYTKCGEAGPRGQQPEQLLLTVQAAPSGGVAATVHGIENTAGIVLDVGYDDAAERYDFGFAGWVPGVGYETNPYGLTLAFLDGRDLLHGNVTGRDDCAPVVAGRVPAEQAPPNPQGLLYKVAVNRVLEPLPLEQCVAYGQWLAGGELTLWSGAWFNSAVTDGAAMRRVLGHDLESWNDEDARKIGVIHRACHGMLESATDPELIRLAGHEIWRGIAPPLSRARSKYARNWRDTYFRLYQPLVADILRTWELADERLLVQSPAEPVRPAGEPAALAGEWRGYFRCEGGNDAFMRLTFENASDPLQAELELASGLKTIRPYGRLTLTGRFDPVSGAVSLAPQAWIEEPRGQMRPMGFDGRLGPAGDVIAGTIAGNATCPEFSVSRRELVRQPVNPEGLLFKVLDRRTVTADVADCRSYAQWLADGDEIKLGPSFFFSGLRDAARLRRTLGKDLDQWGADDHLKLRALSQHCRKLLESQVDRDISELLAQIDAKRLVWAPEPLAVPRQGNTLSHWLRAEQLVMMNEQHQALAAAKLLEAAAFPPVVDSIDAVDALSKEGARRAGGVLEYLSESEREAYLASLAERRVAVSVAAARALAEAWRAQPASYEGLKAVDADHRASQKQFAARKAGEGAAALQQAFYAESNRRADALWPEVIRATRDQLQALADANLSRFPELRENQSRQLYLSTFRAPRGADAYFGDYTTTRERYLQTVEQMVERSTPQILAWIDVLPPSAGANRLLEEFSAEIFDSSTIPDRHPELAAAATAKIRAYNPDGYLRPDIVMSLMRGQWNEVGLVGLEDVAYLTTSLRTIRETCPQAMPRESPALASYAFGLAQQAVARILRGEVTSQAEAERAVWLMLNQVFNQPGCRIDAFGQVTGCVSQADHAAVQEFFMTSSEALLDMRTLLGRGCGEDGAAGFVNGLMAHAGASATKPPAPPIMDFWSFEPDG